MDTIAEALHYSKYHLHRMFTDTVGLTIRTYAQRRRLTEAAKLLVMVVALLFLYRNKGRYHYA